MNGEEVVLAVPRGASGSWDLQALDGSGAPVPLSNGDTFEAIAWGGRDAPPVCALTVAPLNLPGGYVRLTVGPSTTAAVGTGVYRLEVTATRNGQRLTLLTAWLEVTESPGSAGTGTTYCDYDDMVDFGGGAWLPAIRKGQGYTDFSAERARARSWLDNLIASRWRPWSTRRGWADGTSGPVDAPDQTIALLLAGGALILDDQVREVAALKSLVLACDQRVGLEGDDKYARKAAHFRALLENRVACTVARIDTNADGIAEYAIPLGILSIR